MTHNSRYRKQKWVRQFSQKALGIILFALVLLILAGGGFAHGGNAKYIILFIGDGFGSKHIEAVNKYNGDTAPLYQSGPPWVKYMVSTFPEGGSYNTTEAWSDFDYVNTTPDTQDSACTASAIYSGSKTSLGRMSVSSDGSTRLFTIGERAKELGKAVGAISTVPASHATPGAWVAHNDSRINTFAIADEGFFGNPNTTGSVTTNTKYGGGHGSTMPPADVMIGGNVTNYISDQILNKLRTESGQAGKHVLVERKTGVNGGNALMSAANTSSTLKLAGLFNQVYHNANGGGYNSDNPTLSESVLATVKVLSRNPNGFVLMVEGGAIDWASHANNMNQMIGEAKDFYNAIQTVTDWVNDTGNDATWNNTLVIVTADHETGYLTAGPGILADQPLGNVDSTTLSKEKIVYNTGGRKASWEDANSNYLIDTGETVYWYWNSGNHTNSLVPLYARGTGSELFVHYAINIDSVRGPYLDNTDVFSVMNSAIAIAGTATKVAFVQQPTNTTAGAAISPAVTVQLQDDSGNNVYTSDVSVTISLSSGTGVLSGTAVQKTNASGLATFSGLSIDLAGSKNLTATSAGLMSAVSNAFTISDTTPQVAYYRFDESSGTNAADSSGNGNNGVLINGPVWTTGKISNALSFDGVNDYVSTADTPFDFERTNSFSVSAWIKLAPTTLENPIVSKDGAAPSYTGWSFYVEPGSLRVFLTNKWNSPSNGIVKDSAIQVDDNVWHHVAFTYDGTSLASGVNIYIDGNLSNGTVTRNNLSASILNDVPLSIGALAGTSIAFNGLIDDVQIYNRALSGQEVLSLFNNATTPDTTPPEVSATSPVSDATEVEINSAITCTFSEAMDANSIT
ncbi:MAG: alkaline phosphatase, partial [Taibaiella sp.]|nr:alkaline phosphatase [Taibaiella sp.]